MQVTHDVLYIRDEAGNVVSMMDVGSRLWVYKNVTRHIGDYYLSVIAEGKWIGYCVNPAFLEPLTPL